MADELRDRASRSPISSVSRIVRARLVGAGLGRVRAGLAFVVRHRLQLAELAVVLGVAIVSSVPSFGTSARENYDTGSYLTLSLYRPPVVPLFYALLFDNQRAIVVGQTLVGAVCWSYLAVQALEITSRPFSYVAVVAVLFASATDYVTHWYTALLSDSLAISLLALLAGVIVSHLRGRAPLAAVVVVAMLWAGTRDTNACLVLVAGVVSLLACVARRRQVAPVVASAVAVGAGAGVLWEVRVGGAWEQPFEHVLTERILTDPARTSWFAAHGMPVNHALVHLAGPWSLASQLTLTRSPALAAFRHWMEGAGEATYGSYAVLHPLWAIEGTFRRQHEVFNEALIRYYGGTPQHPFVPPFLREGFLVGAQTTILVATGVACVACTVRVCSLRARRRECAWWAGILAAGYLALVIDWVGDSWEIGRHSIDARLEIWLAAAFLTAIVLGGAPSAGTRRPAPRCRSRAWWGRRERWEPALEQGAWGGDAPITATAAAAPMATAELAGRGCGPLPEGVMLAGQLL